MFSLISRPIYLIKHDKIVIRLFVYLSPKIDKYLDTSTIGKYGQIAGFSAPKSALKIGKFLKFKSLRPNTIDILNSQIQSINFNSLPVLPFSSKEQETSFISIASLKGKAQDTILNSVNYNTLGQMNAS